MKTYDMDDSTIYQWKQKVEKKKQYSITRDIFECLIIIIAFIAALILT